MSPEDRETRRLSSLDPVDRAELRGMLDDADLAARIMALPVEPSRRTTRSDRRQLLETRLFGWLAPWRPSVGRVAFAVTVGAVAAVAAMAVNLTPGSVDEQQAGPAAGSSAPLVVTTSSLVTATAPQIAGPSSVESTESPGAGSTADPGAGQPPASGQDPAAATPSSSTPGPTATAADTSTSPPSTTADPTSTSTGGPASTTRSSTTTSRPAATSASTAPTASTATPSTTVGQPGPTNGRFDRGRDLLALHYDHVIYRDDGHATVAAREIVHDLGVSPIVVGGAYGASNTQYNTGSEAVMDATWGPDGWLNAHADRAGAVAAAAQRWSTAIADGDEVWVAEGGQSDYTADVVRAVAVILPDIDLSNRIHVVQHSSANEHRTSFRDLAYLQTTVRYRRIDNGNWDNGTADLNQRDADFVEAALSGPFASAWAEAFDYLDPDQNLDFSDTVEVLHIVGIDRSLVADPGDFADYFMS